MVSQTHYGDHFTVYTNSESLHFTAKNNIMLFFSYTSIKKNRKNSKISLTEMHYPGTEENSEKVRTVFQCFLEGKKQIAANGSLESGEYHVCTK